MRISDWSSDVCSSDLHRAGRSGASRQPGEPRHQFAPVQGFMGEPVVKADHFRRDARVGHRVSPYTFSVIPALRSEEHTSELQSLMRISYAVFCLKKKNQPKRKILLSALVII